MKTKPVQLVYGIRLIATWMIIPFILMFIPMLIEEFSANVTTAEVTLKEEAYSMYPDEVLCFKTDINGRENIVFTSVDAKTGDKVTVILKNGSYYKTIMDENEYRDHVTLPGRFLRISNNLYGYIVIALFAVLMLTVPFTLKKGKEVRPVYPKLAKITDIAGIICAVIMSAGLLYAVIENTLTGVVTGIFALIFGIVYSALFFLAWIIEWLIINKLKQS